MTRRRLTSPALWPAPPHGGRAATPGVVGSVAAAVGNHDARGGRRRGFTMVEMLVALAVLIVAMAVVTSVFTVSTRTAATSAAIAEVQSSVRSLAEQIEADLRGIDPARSVLVIAGRKQAAALTADGLAARQRYRVFVGDSTVPRFNQYAPRFDSAAESARWSNEPRDQYSDPRADILMFFTQRPCASKCPPTESPAPNPGALSPRQQFLASLARGAKIAPTQVVYGHAGQVAPQRQNNRWNFNAVTNVRHIETLAPAPNLPNLSSIPAAEWVLARRQVLIDDVSTGALTTGLSFFFGGNGTQAPGAGADGDNGEFTRILRCYSGDRAAGGVLDRYAGDAATLRLNDYLAYLSPRTADGRTLLMSYPYPVNGGSPIAGVPPRAPAYIQRFVNGLLFPNWSGGGYVPANRHVATVLRETPPELQSNTALQSLPGCAWFQVEFLLPEDPRNAVESPVSGQRNDTPRWVEVPHGETYLFLPDSPENREYILSEPTQFLNAQGTVSNGSRLGMFGQVVPPAAQNPSGSQNTAANRRVRLWPYAIRITIRAFDGQGKLNDPIVRTIVHRFD